MNANRKIKKLMTLTMSGVLAAGMGMSQVYAADTAIEKEETVYVRTTPSGEKQDVIVSDWLKNADGADTITDSTSLQEIENVKGDETYTQDGSTMTWDAKGNDIFYQGKLDKELPVSLKVTYYLEGQEVSPEEIVGKAGHVKIKFEYTNLMKNGEIYTPFLLVTGMILDGENFTNVSIDHGKVVNDGNRNLVVGFGLPGMEESINLDELKSKDNILDYDFDLEIPNGFEVEADAKDFATNLAMTMAMPLDLSGLELDEIEDWDDVRDKIDELKDNVSKLVDGTSELADGVQELKDGCDDLLDGMTELDDGAGKLKEGASALDEGMGELKDGLLTMNKEKRKLISGAKQLSDGLDELNSKKTTLAKGVSDLAKGAKELNKGAGDLNNGMKALYDGINVLDKGRPELVSGIKALVSGINQIENNKKTLTEGASALVTGAKSVSDNLKLTKSGSQQVTDGLKEVNGSLPGSLDQLSSGLKQISDSIDSGLKDGNTEAQLKTLMDNVGLYVTSVNNLANALYATAEDGSGTGYLANAEQVYAGIKQADEGLEQIIQMVESLIGSESEVENTGSTDAAAYNAEDNSEAIAALEEAIEGDQAVLATLYSVRSEKESVPDELQTLFSGAYNKYSSELESSISQMEANIENEQEALAELKQADNTPVPTGENGSQDGEAVITKEQLQQLLGGLKQLKGSTEQLAAGAQQLEAADQQLKVSVPAIVAAGNQLTEGLGTALNQFAGELSKKLVDISNGVKQVNSGVTQMKTKLYGKDGAMHQLAGGSAQVTSGIAQIEAGVTKELYPGTKALSDGINTLFTSGIDIMAAGLNKLGEKIPELNSGIIELKSGAGKLYTGTRDLKAGTTELESGTAELNAGTGELVKGIGQLAEGGEKLYSGVGTLSGGIRQLADGSRELKDGTSELAEGTVTLKEGTEELHEGGTTLVDGVQELLDGSNELKDGVAEFNEKGIQKVTDFLENDLADFVERLIDIKDASTTYHLFSEDSDNENDSVKFIIETDGIK